MSRRSADRTDALLLAETVKLIETEAPLDDAETNRLVVAAGGSREGQLLARAAALGERLGLQPELRTWRERTGIAWLALALLVFLASQGIIASLLGSGRTINAVLAFAAALGLHFFTLALWIAGLLFSPSALARFSLGNLLLRMAALMPARRGGHAARMLPAGLALLERGRLLPWLFGLVSHTVWAAAFILVLLSLWFGFSFREYRLTWESTIQNSDFFVGFIDATAALPHVFGFPVPDAARLLRHADDAGDHRALAYWLLGCVFTYGLLPRLLLALLSALMVRRRRRTLGLDMTDPYYRKLLARFDELDAPVVVDAERRQPGTPDARPAAGSSTAAAALIGFELPPEYDWPPPGLLAAELALNVSGAGDQRREALDLLHARRPRRLLLVCDQASSPDRGTARFMRQAGGCAQHTAILLLAARGQGEDEAYVRRWRAWLPEAGLEQPQLFDDARAAASWLETSHD